MNDLDRLMQIAGNLGILAYQLRELLDVIDDGSGLDEIRAQAALARRQLDLMENDECK